MDFMLLRQNVPGFDRNKPHILDNDIPHDVCEILNPAYGQTCQASMVQNRHYEGCLCNDGVCPDGYTWDSTNGKRWCTPNPSSGCIPGQYLDPTTKTCIIPGYCPQGMNWDGSQCNCAQGTWNGSQCIGSNPPPAPSTPSTPPAPPAPAPAAPSLPTHKNLNPIFIGGGAFLVIAILFLILQKK